MTADWLLAFVFAPAVVLIGCGLLVAFTARADRNPVGDSQKHHAAH